MNDLREEYENISHEEVMRVSDYLLKKYKRAFVALGNAESIEDGRKYFDGSED